MKTYIDAQKQKLDVDAATAEARRSEVHLALVAEDKRMKLAIMAEENRHKLAMMAEVNRVMMADLSSMTEDQKAWMIKRQKEIRKRDA